MMKMMMMMMMMIIIIIIIIIILFLLSILLFVKARRGMLFRRLSRNPRPQPETFSKTGVSSKH